MKYPFFKHGNEKADERQNLGDKEHKLDIYLLTIYRAFRERSSLIEHTMRRYQCVQNDLDTLLIIDEEINPTGKANIEK